MPRNSSADIKSTSLGSPLSPSDRAFMRDTIDACLRRAEYNQLSLKVPKEEGRLQKRPEMHYHFKPELFIQIEGFTEFEVPADKITIKPGEMGIIPAGVPHHETIYTEGKPFRNLVVGFYSNAISIHLAYEAAPQKPDIDVIEFFDVPDLDTFLMLTNGLVEAYHKHAPARDLTLKGMSIALLSLLLSLLETGGSRMNRDIGKVFQAKWLVREQISNTNLNVKTLADKLQCSPDYLSHLYHTQTGEKLIHYIQRIRIEGAVLALETTPLYISEIAWASGFSDPAYFARVFKKFTGMSPQDFRASKDQSRQRGEGRPKTIYYDREDYSPGKPAHS